MVRKLQVFLQIIAKYLGLQHLREFLCSLKQNMSDNSDFVYKLKLGFDGFIKRHTLLVNQAPLLTIIAFSSTSKTE